MKSLPKAFTSLTKCKKIYRPSAYNIFGMKVYFVNSVQCRAQTDRSNMQPSSPIVTLWYRAPEVLLGANKYSCPIDMWSIGCIFAEMASKKPLFQGDSEIDQLFRIFRVLKTPTEEIWPGVTQLPDYKPTFPNWVQYNLTNQVKNMDDDGLDLLKKLLVYSPADRLSAKQAIRHTYFDKLDMTKVPTTTA